jgi:hypothetical protein
METNTCSFSKPQYTRVTNQNGTMEARYTFAVTSTNPLVVSYNRPAPIKLQLQETVATNNAYVINILTMFLTSCSHYFAKPYTVEGIQRILQHAMSALPEQPTDDDYDILFQPTGITIMQGKFILDWSASFQKIRITIPDLDQPSQEDKSAPKESTDELIQVDDLEEDLRQMEEPNERDSSRHYEKRKVKEARLRARLAQYKAERAMSKYLEKYGADISDSDWTGSSSDDDDDDESN